MASPQGGLSTIPQAGIIGDPDNRPFYALESYERGPIAIEDVSEGLQYQNWTLTWDSGTNVLTATPETTGPPVSLITEADLIYMTFTFDQNARISFTWTTSVSSFLYWYDTQLGQTVTTDLGADVITPTILLDDKRETMNSTNDMLLWYTKEEVGGGTYELFQLLQRERFLIESSEATGLFHPYLTNIGMANNLRVHIVLSDTPPWGGLPVEGPSDSANLDFEAGDINWTQEAGADFSINQDDPQTGSWNATLATVPANYSRFVNDEFFPVTGSQSITIKANSKALSATTYAFGFQAYDGDFNYVGRYQLVANAGATWQEAEWNTTVPTTAVHIRLVLSSNGTDGTVYLDNLTLAT